MTQKTNPSPIHYELKYYAGVKNEGINKINMEITTLN